MDFLQIHLFLFEVVKHTSGYLLLKIRLYMKKFQGHTPRKKLHLKLEIILPPPYIYYILNKYLKTNIFIFYIPKYLENYSILFYTIISLSGIL